MEASRLALCAVTVIAACGALGLLGDQPVGAATTDRWLITPYAVAGIHPFDSNVTHEVTAFRSVGISLRVSQQFVCLLTSQTVGIQLAFGSYALSGGKLGVGGCSEPTLFMDATVVDQRWHTGRGLHVGDPLARLRLLYPTASDLGLIRPRFRTTNYTAWWWLTELPAGVPEGTILTALTTHGHVVGLATEVVGH